MPKTYGDGRFEKPVHLLVEGHDEVVFCEALLETLGLEEKIQIHNYEGKNNLRNYLKKMMTTDDEGGLEGYLGRLVTDSGFLTKVKSLGIIRDADDDAFSAFESVRGALKKWGLPCPETLRESAVNEDDQKVSVFISPDNENPGMLETMLLNSAADKAAVECTDQLFECLKQGNSEEYPKNEAKARLQVFMSTRKEFPNHLKRSIQKKIWDFDAPAFDGIKTFITSLTVL